MLHQNLLYVTVLQCAHITFRTKQESSSTSSIVMFVSYRNANLTHVTSVVMMCCLQNHTTLNPLLKESRRIPWPCISELFHGVLGFVCFTRVLLQHFTTLC